VTETRNRKVERDKVLQAYEQVATVAKVFAEPIRLEIIEELAQSARTVESLAQVCGLPDKTISHHLQKLRAAGIVERVKLGRRAVYSLTDENVASFWVALRRFSEKRSMIQSDVVDFGEGVTADSLARLVSHQRVVVIDVRPPEEFASGHLPGALSIPESELANRIDELPRGRPVVAFCRGPYCKLADRAVAALRKNGFEALRCADGVVEWRDAGLSLVTSQKTGDIIP